MANSTGLSQSQVASIAFGSAAHLGLNSPLGGASVNANAGKSYQAGLSTEERKVLGSMSNEQIAEFKQFGDRVSRDTSFSNAVGNDSREARELASRLATTASRSERADASFAERTALAERLSSAREHGEALSIDIAQDPHNLKMFMRYAEQYGGSSAAASAMFDAELARQGLRPNRTFSSGSAMPTSFDDLRDRHAREASESKLNPDVAGASRKQGRHVARFGNISPGVETPSSTWSLREEVQAKASEIRHRTEGAQGNFDSKAEIIPTQDGTLASKKSLLKQTGKQVVNDGSASIGAAKDAVKDLLRRKN